MLSPNKDLRFAAPVWTAYAMPRVPQKTLRADLSTDIVVVGAGIGGALMAEELTEAGFRVAIVDRRGAGRGSTLATTALLQYEIDQPLQCLAKTIGFDRAAAAWRRAKLALDSLAAKTRSLDIRCDLRRQLSLYVAGDLLDVDGLHQERIMRRQIALYCDFLDRERLRSGYGVAAQAALRSFDTFSANPCRLCAQYLQVAQQRGAIVLAPLEIVDVQPHADGVTLLTAAGPVIRARQAVFATGYEVIEPLHTQEFKVASTWAFATVKQGLRADAWPMIWQAADPYLYLRTTPDGRILCGGEDEAFTTEQQRNALTEAKVILLQDKLARLLPDVEVAAEYRWAGSFGETPTGLPLIGQVPGLPNCFAVMAFGGNGITFSRLGAELVRGALTGKPDPDEKLFAFAPVQHHAAGEPRGAMPDLQG